ncbi:MAG TPA: ACP S-malonyltransferase [Alphaproteobacteria bacterium]|jgi:[acyl-carrier-protein] S-malonyltransferase|nr:ACP S-malonyltransferase [Alphaproteobacteria bacterium]HIK87220.1 [acyl-carrier-protein] S-malonyltransferase [Alphaproteobacteria bacterium]
MSNAFIFPGQGSQKIGMGKDLFDSFTEAKEVFEEVDDALSLKLSKIIFEGDEEELKLTINTQPALMCMSYAIVRVIEKMLAKPLSEIAKFTAGHSLGEYSALVSAGSIKLSDAAKILRLRGEAMQNAVPLNIGAMAALIGVDIDIINKIRSNYIDIDEVLDIGNDNSPGQMVISGHNSAVEKVINNYKALGIKRAIKLPVSAPFHCRLMKKAADNMETYIADLKILCPKIILINNVDAASITDPIKIKEGLIRQITETVRWRESIQNMCELGSSYFVEVGAGNVLSGLVKRINKNVESISIQNIDDIENFVNNLEG